MKTYLVIHKNGAHATRRPPHLLVSDYGVIEPGGDTPAEAWSNFAALVAHHGGTPPDAAGFLAVGAVIREDRTEFDWTDLHELPC